MEISVDNLIKKFSEYSNQDTTLMELAYNFAKEAHGLQKRASGELFFTHVYSVADILLDYKMDQQTICAGLLHDTVEDTKITIDIIKKEFGDEIANLVEGVTKIETLKFSSRDEAQAQNWRKMILATAKDIRVIMIKLADRLHNMRTLNYLSPEKQIEIAHETISLYAPLAQRLGIFQLKSELEDLSFKYLNKEEYEMISTKMQLRYFKREKILEDFKNELNEVLKNSNIPYRILYRAKNIYSIYRKMQKQNKPFEEIEDALGVRIITDTVMNCYVILGIVHSHFKPVVGSFTDYIAMPKKNLYQSLHTTVMSKLGEAIEIQIRTEDMHKTAEYGIAAHWRYKLGENASDKHLDEKLNWLRQWIEWLQELESPREFLESFKTDLELEQIFVFTPKGDVKPLPVNSTPVDFAYAIHSEIGDNCVGAKVNGKMVKLDHELKSGDICEIVTRKNSGAKKDWLNFVKTASAKSKIRKYLKEHGITD